VDLTLGETAKVLSVPLRGGDSIPVRGVSTDSRTLKKGMLFFALRGERYDGHCFVDEVLAKGACGAVVEQKWLSPGRKEKILLPVTDSLRALQDVASHYRQKFRFPVVAVTGTNGKTTTKEMISSVLATQYRVMKSPGNLNNHIGVALSVCAWEEGGELAVVEMGANHFGEIRRLCEIVRPTHGLITNIGKGHLEFFTNIEGVVRAKAELLEFLGGEGKTFLNGDDPHLFPLKNIAGEVVTYGFSDRCDLRGEDLGVDGSGFPRMKVGEATVRIPVPGRHNLYNGLAAAVVGRAFGISWSAIKEGLESCHSMEKRMELLKFGGVTILNDTYNANPSSVPLVLMTLRAMKGVKRRIAVLGDMLELGKRSEEEHRNVGEWVVESGMDVFFCYGMEMGVAAERAKELGINQVRHFNSKSDLVEVLENFLEEGDLVLVKGSRGIEMEEIVEELRRGLHGEAKE